MAVTRIPKSELLRLWQEHGVALCAEAQADGVSCTALGRSCETCERAYAAWLATNPDKGSQNSQADGTYGAYPECG